MAAAEPPKKQGFFSKLSTGQKVGLGAVGGIAAGVLAVEGAQKLEKWEHQEEKKFAGEIASAAGLGGAGGGYGGGYGGRGYEGEAFVGGGSTIIAGGGPSIVEVYQPSVVEYVETGPGYYGSTTFVDDSRVIDNNTVVQK